jgi:[CysO sulfur-carrier protein]-S-L-cysteine hydrolase
MPGSESDSPCRRPAALILPIAIRTEILRHLQAAAPLEGVGLLAATEGDGGDEGGQRSERAGGPAVRAVRFYPGTNGAASATRYTMPPEEVLAAFEDMRIRGWRLGAIVHSHPRGPATPSPTDLREAYYPEALMVIVSFAVVPPGVRAWWVGAADGRPREVPVVGGGADDVPTREAQGGEAVGTMTERGAGESDRAGEDARG